MDDLLFLTEALNNVVPRSKSYDLIPAGYYTVNITGSEKIDNPSGDGEQLKVTFEIASGPHAGRLLWERFNVVHSNPEWVGWAFEKLAGLKILCGIESLKSTNQLLGHQIMIKVDQKKRKTSDVVDNVIYFDPPKGSQPQQARPSAPQAATSAAAAAASSAQPSWRYRASA